MSRREDRQRLDLTAQCRMSDGKRELSISDISSSGCRLAVGVSSIPVDQRVILSPRGLESLAGTVKWCSDGYAGIEFDRPIHVAVVDHLCRLYPDKTPISLCLAA